MNFYKQYPMMLPYIGKNFHKGGAPSILLVGESHYLEGDCPQRRSPESWYSSSSDTLCETDIEWISTAAILEGARAQGFSNKAHSIWSNAFRVINEYGPRYSDYMRVADDVALYNFFLRPAVDGNSIKHELSGQDVEIANEAFLHHCKALKPTEVVFLSMLASDHCKHSLSIPSVAVPHPGCAHWNGVRAKYGNRTGRDLLVDFMRSVNWNRSPVPNSAGGYAPGHGH